MMMKLARLLLLLLTSYLVKCQVLYSCPSGWITDQPNRRCYKFVYYPQLPYVLAAKACAESYSSLVSITTSGEHSFINNHLMTFDSNRNQWYTSGAKLAGQYIWEGEGISFNSINPAINYWMQGYQFIPHDRVIYTVDYISNSYRWYIGQNTVKRSYICEIGQEEAYRVLIQKRDFSKYIVGAILAKAEGAVGSSVHPLTSFSYGTPYLNEDEVPTGPTFDVDRVPENIWFLGSTKSLYLECLAVGNPQPSYKWLTGPTDQTIDQELDASSENRYIVTNGKLTINDPTDSDANYYRCEASNTEGKIISNFAHLSLGRLGEFSNVADAPVTAYMFEGSVIQCSKIHYEPTVVYNWERITGTSQDIILETIPHIFISSNGRLYFSEVQDSDAAVYHCRVSLSGISRNVVGTAQPPSAVSRPIILNVNIQAAKDDWGPIMQDDFINVFPNPPSRGQDVRLECFAYGTANNYKNSWKYIWTREGGLPSKAKFESFNRILILENAQAEDEGRYTCLVTRGSGQASRDYTLVLQTKPYFLMELQHQHIDIGSQLTWQCLADGNPAPVYSWYFNGFLISPNNPNFIVRRNILIIQSADPVKHNGMFQCGATNVKGQILSSAQLRVLQFPPSFAKHPLPSSLSGAIRGNISIPCNPEGSPRPEIKWQRRDARGSLIDISATVNQGQIDSTNHYQLSMNGALIIINIATSDAGTYICTATNDQGEDSSGCELKVQEGTTLFRTPLPTYDTYYQNDTIFIQCEASYDPDLDLIYVWKFNGKMLDFEKESYFYTQSFNPVGLYIKPLQYYHDGVYECTALTPLTAESAKGIVTVKGVPEAPSGVYADSGRVTTKTIVLYWTTGNDRGNPILEYEVMSNVQGEDDKWYLAHMERIFHTDTEIPDPNVEDIKRTFLLRDLLPGNNYRFKIRSKNIKGWGEYSLPSAFYKTQFAAPDLDYNQINLNLTGGGGSVGDLVVRWNPLPPKYHGAPGLYYTVFWKRINTEVWSAANKTSTKNDMEKGQLEYYQLVGDENYYLPYDVKIMPGNSYGRGQNSTEVVIYSAMQMPTPAPKISHCIAINSTAMDIYWTPIENTRESIGGYIAGFQVTYWEKPDDPKDPTPPFKQFIRFNTVDGVVPTHGVVIGLKINGYSIFDVQVFNTAGLGPKSDSYPCETANDPTHLYPTEIVAHPVDGSSVMLTWRGVLITTDEATVEGYKIFLWPSNENFRTAVEYMADFMPTKYTLTGLERGVVYACRISGVSSAGDGQKSPTIYFAIAGGPATLIDQTVTEFSYLSGASITSSIILIAMATVFVYFMS